MKQNVTAEGITSPVPSTMTSAEMREALGGISRTTEHRWIQQGILHPVRIVRRKLYRSEDIASLIETGGRTAATAK